MSQTRKAQITLLESANPQVLVLVVKLYDTHEPYVKTVMNNCNSRPMLSLFSSLGNRCNCSAGLYPCWVELSSLVAWVACSPNGFGKTQFQAMYFTKHAHARYRYEHAHKPTIHTLLPSTRSEVTIGWDKIPHTNAPLPLSTVLVGIIQGRPDLNLLVGLYA